MHIHCGAAHISCILLRLHSNYNFHACDVARVKQEKKTATYMAGLYYLIGYNHIGISRQLTNDGVGSTRATSLSANFGKCSREVKPTDASKVHLGLHRAACPPTSSKPTREGKPLANPISFVLHAACPATLNQFHTSLVPSLIASFGINTSNSTHCLPHSPAALGLAPVVRSYKAASTGLYTLPFNPSTSS